MNKKTLGAVIIIILIESEKGEWLKTDKARASIKDQTFEALGKVEGKFILKKP